MREHYLIVDIFKLALALAVIVCEISILCWWRAERKEYDAWLKSWDCSLDINMRKSNIDSVVIKGEK